MFLFSYFSFNKSYDPKLAEENCSILSAVTSIDIILKNEVDIYLECLSMQNQNLVVLYNHKAIIRRDHNLLTDQVKILSGGASGNEPLHAGFVGEGLLTAAIMGDINSCPPHTSILAVIRELSTNNSSGIFVIIMNYASHRLNFGLAIQNAVMEGIKIAAVIVEDDCSGIITDKTVGRRTLAGVVFMHKVVGAMAEDKKTLYEIECISKSISKNNLGTINIHINEDEVIFGVSLKGEGGKHKNMHKVNNSEQIVRLALSFIVDPASYFSLVLKKNDPVAILVNNFKGLSDFDLSLYVNKVVNLVHMIPLNIVALYFGNYLSSQSIHGFSITLFKVDNPRVMKWLCNQSSKWFPAKTKPLDEIEFYVEEQNALRHKIEPRKLMIGPKFSNEDIVCIEKVLCAIANHLLKSEIYLNFLDLDHDLGTTMSNFAFEIECKQNSNEINMTTPYALLTSLSEIAGYSMRGLSSGIYSTLFSSAGQVSRNNSLTRLKCNNSKIT